VPLPDECASVVIGEAMLSMQLVETKRAIIGEAYRLLRRNGRYLVHELALQPEGVDDARVRSIQADLSSVIHVGVRIGTRGDWQGWLADAGFEVEDVTTMPMRLLEPDRMLRDEGLLGMSRFALNVLRTPGAAQRLLSVRRMFRKYHDHLSAIGIIARRRA
jgi:ubiquinone/menaquinone biosynthesis C-methylase UbiE